MKLKITEESIQKGLHDCWDYCPIAIEAKKKWPGNSIQVFNGHISVNGVDFPHTRDTRSFAAEWDKMQDQDDDEGPAPVPCELNFPNISSALRRRKT